MRKRILALILVLAMCIPMVLSGCSLEDEGFPSKEIEIVVPAGAGGGSDLWARAMADQLSKILGVPVNVLNQPGGNEAIGRAEVVSREADGHTLFITTTTHVTETALGNNGEFESLVGLALVHQDTYGLHVLNGGRFASIEDLIAYAKDHPGEVKIGGTYPKSLDELTLRQLEAAAGISINYIPYDEAGQLQADVLGGHIDALIDEFTSVRDLIASGDMLPLVAFSATRLVGYEDVPTTVEKGWDVTDGMLRGILIKEGTPDEVVAILQDAIKKAYESEEYQEFAAGRMLNLRDVFCDGKAYQALMEEKVEEYRKIFAELG